VISVAVGFIVAVTSNFGVAFAETYNFKSYQASLCFFAGIVGCIIGVLSGGHLSDIVADYFTEE
jgi:hypothetical protein